MVCGGAEAGSDKAAHGAWRRSLPWQSNIVAWMGFSKIFQPLPAPFPWTSSGNLSSLQAWTEFKCKTRLDMAQSICLILLGAIQWWEPPKFPWMAQCYPHHPSRTCFVIPLLFLLTPAHREPPAPSLLAAAVHEAEKSPNPLQSQRSPWKSHFSQALIILSWLFSLSSSFLEWKSSPKFLCQCSTLISEFCFCLGSPQGNSLYCSSSMLGAAVTLQSAQTSGLFLQKIHSCEAGSSCWTSRFFLPLCLLNYRLLLLSFVKAVWNLNPPRSSFQLPIKTPKFNEHNLQSFSRSLEHCRAQTESVSCASSTTQFTLNFHREVIFQEWFPDEFSELMEQEGPCWWLRENLKGLPHVRPVKCHCFSRGNFKKC